MGSGAWPGALGIYGRDVERTKRAPHSFLRTCYLQDPQG